MGRVVIRDSPNICGHKVGGRGGGVVGPWWALNRSLGFLSGVFWVRLSAIWTMVQKYLRSDQLGIIPGQGRFFGVCQIGEGFEQIARIPSGAGKSPEVGGALERDAHHLGTGILWWIIWTLIGRASVVGVVAAWPLFHHSIPGGLPIR